MKPISLFSWLYDVILDARGIRFVLLRVWTIHLLKIENIESITEINQASFGSLNAYNFKNRLFARSYLIKTKRGWFARKILITPKDPDEFLVWSRGKGLVWGFRRINFLKAKSVMLSTFLKLMLSHAWYETNAISIRNYSRLYSLVCSLPTQLPPSRRDDARTWRLCRSFLHQPLGNPVSASDRKNIQKI